MLEVLEVENPDAYADVLAAASQTLKLGCCFLESRAG